VDGNGRSYVVDGDCRILLDSLIYTSEQMLVMAESGEWDLLPSQQADRDAIMERVGALRLADNQVAELYPLFERAKILNDALMSKVVCQREFARNKLMELRRAERMQQGYGSTADFVPSSF